MLVEVAALRVAILPPRPDAGRWSCGRPRVRFAVAIKPQGLGTVLLVACWILVRARRRAPSAAAVFACGFAPLALVWPVINLLSYGSPLPQIMLLWPPRGGYLPQMRETMAVLMSNFGLWYRLNYARLFSQGMEGWTLFLVCGAPFLLKRQARRDPAIRLLLGFAVGRALLLTVLSRGDPAIVFHDRYHLASYIALGIAVMLAVHHAVEERNFPGGRCSTTPPPPPSSWRHPAVPVPAADANPNGHSGQQPRRLPALAGGRRPRRLASWPSARGGGSPRDRLRLGVRVLSSGAAGRHDGHRSVSAQ